MAGTRRLEEQLAEDGAHWRAAGLQRDLEHARGPGVDFTSNDVLGLSQHPDVIAAAVDAAQRFGAGGRASRLLGGGSPLDREVEREVADWLGTEDALLFASGYHANLGVIGALVGPGDVVLADALIHASLVDAIRLSRARAVVYAHADPEDLARKIGSLQGSRRTLVATESVFSMDGDMAPLGRIGRVCERHGASLLVDEAHACGIVGPEGAGGWAALDADESLEAVLVARIVTGGKALGAAGGIVASTAVVRDHLVQRARTLAFTTALPPAVAGGLRAGIRITRTDAEARSRTRAMAIRIARALDLEEPSAAIVPIPMADPGVAMDAAARLSKAGLHVRAVRPPTVPPGTSRLRVVCHAYNTLEEVDHLIEVLRSVPITRAASATGRTAPRRARPLVVCGTDTGIGKTVVSALLTLAAYRRQKAAYWKPVQTGDDSDTDAVRALVSQADVHAFQPGYVFGRPASPHEAAEAEGKQVDVASIDEALANHLGVLGSGTLVTELAGGLLVPWTWTMTQLDWLARVRPPLVLVARSGLGTLNHVLLSLEALGRRHLDPRALFLVGPAHEANRETLRRLTRIPAIFEVPVFDPLDTASLEAWLAEHDLSTLWLEPRA